MASREIILEALKVYTSHAASQVTRKRAMSDKLPTVKELERIAQIRNKWKLKFKNANQLLNRMVQGEPIKL